jgi:putative lipoprotein
MRSIAQVLLFALSFSLGCKTDINEQAALEDPARVSGNMTYLQRVALPPDAVAYVSLFVVPHPGAPATLVNEATIADVGQVPIPFEIWYRRDTIDAHRLYGLRARIDAEGKTWFENKDLVPVITNGILRDVQIMLDMSPR